MHKVKISNEENLEADVNSWQSLWDKNYQINYYKQFYLLKCVYFAHYIKTFTRYLYVYDCLEKKMKLRFRNYC